MTGLIELAKSDMMHQFELLRALPSDVYEYFPSYKIEVEDCKSIGYFTHKEEDGVKIKCKTIIRIPKLNDDFHITATHSELHLVKEYVVKKSEVEYEASWGNVDHIEKITHDVIRTTLNQAYQIIICPSLVEDTIYKSSDSGFISELNRVTVMLTNHSLIKL